MHFNIAAIADAGLEQQLSARIDAKTKPPGSLGRLESVAIQLGLIQRSSAPRIVAPHLLVFAADHGVTVEGVSAYPQEVTWQMVMNFLAGGAAVNVFASAAGLSLKVIDAGVDHAFDPHPHLVDRKIANGTRNFAREAAMTMTQAEEAITAGATLVRELAAKGSNVIAFGEMGIGNTSAASALMARLTGLPLELCIGRGTGLDDSGLARKRAVIEAALARHAGARGPLDALAALGGFEIAMICGAMLTAAEVRMVIVVDGFRPRHRAAADTGRSRAAVGAGGLSAAPGRGQDPRFLPHPASQPRLAAAPDAGPAGGGGAGDGVDAPHWRRRVGADSHRGG